MGGFESSPFQGSSLGGLEQDPQPPSDDSPAGLPPFSTRSTACTGTPPITDLAANCVSSGTEQPGGSKTGGVARPHVHLRFPPVPRDRARRRPEQYWGPRAGHAGRLRPADHRRNIVKNPQHPLQRAPPGGLHRAAERSPRRESARIRRRQRRFADPARGSRIPWRQHHVHVGRFGLDVLGGYPGSTRHLPVPLLSISAQHETSMERKRILI